MSVYGVSGGVTVGLKKIYDIKNGVTRKLSKGYVIENGLTKKIYSGFEFGYTGTYTTQEITKDGKPYTLYIMTTSGILTLNDDADYWMCGGGAAGEKGAEGLIHFQSGDGGAGGYIADGTISPGQWIVTIGAGGAQGNDGGGTSVQLSDVTYSAAGGEAGGNGGSGAGGSCFTTDSSITSTMGYRAGGTGQGVSTYPFGIESLFAHGAGGGGGGMYFANNNGKVRYGKGGAGGSNGADGGAATEGSSTAYTSETDYGVGGEKGGGNGGSAYSYKNRPGKAGSFYGAGGGGGGVYAEWSDGDSFVSDTAGGAGYQGVFYLLIP